MSNTRKALVPFVPAITLGGATRRRRTSRAASCVAACIALAALQIASSAQAALMNYWPFENNHTDIAGGNNGAVTGTEAYGAPAPATGGVASFSFDGSTFVNLTHFERPGNMTIAAWINTSTTGTAEIFGWGRASGTPRGTREFRVNGGTGGLTYGEYNSWPPSGWLATDSTAVVSDGTWHHVAVVRSGTAVSFYIDGALALSVGGIAQAATPNYTDHLYIGALNNLNGVGGSKYRFSGLIDDLGLWNEALGPWEIQNVMRLGPENYIPEPSTLALAAIGLVGYARRRRRR